MYVIFSMFGLTKEWPGNKKVSLLLGWFRHIEPSFFCCAHSKYRNAIELDTTCSSERTFPVSFLGYFFLLFALLQSQFKSVDYSHDWCDAFCFLLCVNESLVSSLTFSVVFIHTQLRESSETRQCPGFKDHLLSFWLQNPVLRVDRCSSLEIFFDNTARCNF